MNDLEVLTTLAGYILLEAKTTMATAEAVRRKEISLTSDENFRENLWKYADAFERRDAVEGVIKRLLKARF